MALDEPKDNDEVFEVNNFTMIVDKQLHEQTRDIAVDYGVYGMSCGFRVTSEVPIAGGGGCGTSCSC